jgi:hypothetical protein
MEVLLVKDWLKKDKEISMQSWATHLIKAAKIIEERRKNMLSKTSK